MSRDNNADHVLFNAYQLKKQQLPLQSPQAYRTRGNRKIATQMDTVKILAIALSAAFLLLDPMTKAVPVDPPQRSLCMPQHGGSHNGSSSEDNCCKWLKELDEQCVCDVLYRLPPFLSKPAHTYTLYVAEACNVTYSCGMHL
ncbi:hypothetical protein POTOM_048479 [Populus tomentosa]|uniref:Uncharacterized protein n=1 Tax=Populus tomentosa TaxID=118781 RepID=A0A8X8C4M4_POPTO|nr:hypothetical protein POTOM_048479 [Populus tomentosa]